MSDIESSDHKDFNNTSEVNDSETKMSLSVTTTTTNNNTDDLGKYCGNLNIFYQTSFK